MAIPASHIVSAQPRVISGGGADLQMNGLLLSRSNLIPVDAMALSFGSASSVGDYFGTDSREYAAAVVYFTGYDNKFSAPEAFFVARRVDESVPAWLRGAAFTRTLASLKTVTDGGLIITIDGAVYSVTGLDFSGAGSFSDAAQILAEALAARLSGVSAAWSSVNKAFTITSPTKGEASGIGYAESPASGTDLSALFGLAASSGAVLSQGAEAMNADAQMRAVRSRTENWVTFTTMWEADAEEMREWAAWANSNYGWMYAPWTTDASTPLQTSAADPASLLKDAGYDHTAIVYGSLDYAMFIMGAVASVDWERVNGSITFAFKAQSGLAAQVDTQSAAEALEAKNCNYFGNFATRNADFVFLYPGALSASDYGFIDPYINSVWLNNRIQRALLDGLSSSGRVPYNDRGYTMIRSWLMDPVNAALNNSVIEPGVELSEAQRSELMNEAGQDISSELKTQGYFIQILDPGASSRAKRESPVVSLWYTYGGAVQRIEIASTAVL